MVIWGVAIGHFVLGALGIRLLETESSLPSFLLVVFVYVIGYQGLRQPEVLWPADAPARSPASSSAAPLDPGRAGELERRLLALMEDAKPHLDPDLTLRQLADRLGVSTHNLSEVINARLDRTFHDFVNEYRVREAKRVLADPASARLTVLAVGMEAGFRSKSTFNKIFRRFTGMTPSEVRRAAPRD